MATAGSAGVSTAVRRHRDADVRPALWLAWAFGYQGLRTELAKARDELAGVLDRDPTVKELAELLDLSEEEIIEGLVAAAPRAPSTPRTPTVTTRPPAPEADAPTPICSATLPAMELTEDLHTLAPLLGQLDDSERRILQMRFGQEMTQAEIGKELGISQMHVSRLLTRSLAKLRAGMLTEHCRSLRALCTETLSAHGMYGTQRSAGIVHVQVNIRGA